MLQLEVVLNGPLVRKAVVALHDEGDSNYFLHDNEVFHVTPTQVVRTGDAFKVRAL